MLLLPPSPLGIIYTHIIVVLVTVVRHILGHNTGLLTSTLFTFRDHACENEKLKVRCPYGTTISIQAANFGRQVPSSKMCSFGLMVWPVSPRQRDKVMNSTSAIENTKCITNDSLKVLLHHCQNKRHCDVLASTKTFREDACPGTSKYLEVAYKCRPNEFRSRNSCEGKQMALQCQRSKRIAIYSAMFGRSPKINAGCPADGATDTDCQAKCALQIVMRFCHGRRRCNLSANEQTFGNPCDADTPKYLNVVYACVPRRILREMKNGENFPYSFCNVGPGSNATWLEPTVPTTVVSSVPVSPSSKANNIRPDDLLAETTPNVTSDDTVAAVQQRKIGLVNDWMFTFQYMKENREKVILYLILGVCCGTIFVLLALVLKLSVWNRNHGKKHHRKLEISEPIHSPGTHENQSLLDMTDNSDGIEMLSYRQTPFSRPTPHMRSDTSSTTSPHSTLSRPPPHMRSDSFAQRGGFDRSPSPTSPRNESGSSSQNSPSSPVGPAGQPQSTFGPNYGSAGDVGMPRNQRQNSFPGTGPDPVLMRDANGSLPRSNQMPPILRNSRQRTYGQPQQPPPQQGVPRTLRSESPYGSLPRSSVVQEPRTLRSESPQAVLPRNSVPMQTPERTTPRPGNNHITFAPPRHPSDPYSPMLPPAGYGSPLKPDLNHRDVYGQPAYRNNNGPTSMTLGPNAGFSLPPPHLRGDNRAHTLSYR